MIKRKSTPTSHYYKFSYIRAPESSDEANAFISRFYAVNLAFNFDVTAKDSTKLSPLLALALQEHMATHALQLRAIEGHEPRAINTAIPMDGWQVIYNKSIGRANLFGGTKWHVMTRPNIHECTIKDIVRSGEKVPQFNPPLAGKLLMMICKFYEKFQQ